MQLWISIDLWIRYMYCIFHVSHSSYCYPSDSPNSNETDFFSVIIFLSNTISTIFNKAMNQLVDKKNFLDLQLPPPLLFPLLPLLSFFDQSAPPILFSSVPTSAASIFTSCSNSSFCYFSSNHLLGGFPPGSFSFTIHSTPTVDEVTVQNDRINFFFFPFSFFFFPFFLLLLLPFLLFCRWNPWGLWINFLITRLHQPSVPFPI